MALLSVNSQYHNTIEQSHFGGNFLFNRDELEPNGTYENLAADLGVQSFRYPGGSITERLFDITDPDRETAYDDETESYADLVSLSDFMGFADESGHSVTIVIPTRDFLSDSTDENGDRYPDFDHDELAVFVRDVALGVYGDAKVDAFEIGNEYWGSGQMSAVEYGRLASEMAKVTDDALASVADTAPDGADVEVVVQSGTNFDHSNLSDQYAELDSPEAILQELSEDYQYSFDEQFLFDAGEINWTAVNDQLIRNEFSHAEFSAIDGVATHVYSRGEDNPDFRDFSLSQIEKTWITENPDLKTYVTEWNLKSEPGIEASSGYGLKQAHEMLNIMEEFSEHSVDVAHVWPLLQNTRNALAPGSEYEELSAAGEMFKLMEEVLPGSRPIDLSGSGSSQNELAVGDLDVHAFGNEDQLVLFLASTSEDYTSTELDLANIASGGASISVTFLGVEEGDDPGSIDANAVIEVPSQEEIDAEIFREGQVRADLGQFEIMRVVIDQPEWTAEMEGYWSAVGGDDDDPILGGGEGSDPIDEEPLPQGEEGDGDGTDDDGLFVLLGGLLLLPVLLGFA